MTAIAATVAFALTTTACGSKSKPWVIGAPYMITEKQAQDSLTTPAQEGIPAFRGATCTGLPQFGHEYESSAAKFRVFKCAINMYHPGGGMVACGPSRFRAVTGDQPGHARLVLLRKGKCS